MFLDTFPVSYVIYTEAGTVNIIVGLEVHQDHWELANSVNASSFGLLPLFIGSHKSFDELMSSVPKDDITKTLESMSDELYNYIEDSSVVNFNNLIKKYNTIYNA